MALQLSGVVPGFTQAQLGPINLYDFVRDSWVVLFSHLAPSARKDSASICTTRLGEVTRLQPEGKKRNARSNGRSSQGKLKESSQRRRRDVLL